MKHRAYEYYKFDFKTFVVINTTTKSEVCVCSDYYTGKVDEYGSPIWTTDAIDRAQIICNALNGAK
jgi:hypothetical protein